MDVAEKAGWDLTNTVNISSLEKKKKSKHLLAVLPLISYMVYT